MNGMLPKKESARAVPRHPRKETRMVLGRRVSEDLWLWYIRYAVWDWVRGPVYAGLLGRHEVSSLYSSPVSLPGQGLCAAHARCAVESGAWSGVLLCRLMFSLVCVQGEDGFPGFKGDMGIKGDRVSVMGLGFGPVTSRVGMGDLHESHRCLGSQRSLSEGRQHLCKTWSEQQVSGAQGLCAVFSSLLLSSHPKARQLSPVLTTRTSVVTDTVLWLGDLVRTGDPGLQRNLTPEDEEEREWGGNCPDRPISKPPPKM